MFGEVRNEDNDGWDTTDAGFISIWKSTPESLTEEITSTGRSVAVTPDSRNPDFSNASLERVIILFHVVRMSGTDDIFWAISLQDGTDASTRVLLNGFYKIGGEPLDQYMANVTRGTHDLIDEIHPLNYC